MPNLLEHRFAIKRITKPSNEDYISALKIYNETTPPDIKTYIKVILNRYYISKRMTTFHKYQKKHILI